MATTTAVSKPVTPTADAPKQPLSRTYKVDVSSPQHRIWTRVSRVRQLLSPLKVPSNDPTAPRPTSSLAGQDETVNGAPTAGCQSHCQIQDPTRDSGYASYDPSTESVPDGESVSAAQFPLEPAPDGFPQQEVASDGRSAHTVTGARVSRADTQDVKHNEEFPPTCSPGPSEPPANGAALSIPAPRDVGTSALTSRLVEVAFNDRSAEKLSHQHFMDKRLAIPDAVVQMWNEDVKKRLDEDLQQIIGGISVGTDHIFSETQLYMAGTRRGNMLLAEPTILITCGTKACRKRVDRYLSRLKLHYLDDFGHPIRVRYQPAPAYWASSSVLSAIEENESSVPVFGFSSLRQLWIEHTWSSTACGLKMRFDFTPDRQTRQCYATLGGIVRIDNIIYGMTTAHTFLARLDNGAESSALEDTDTDSASSGYGSGTETETAVYRNSSKCFSYSDMSFKSLWRPKFHHPAAFSFLGHVSKNNGIVTDKSPSRSDWALVAVPYSCVLPNLNSSSELQSVIPETELLCGDVSILCGADVRCTGLLTQTNTSLHTGTTTMEVREILLAVPLAGGASGAWVVRDTKVCGYVVAVTGRGLSCFMVPMERAFKDIEAVFGKTVTLGHCLKAESIVDHSQASTQPHMNDASVKRPPVRLETSEQPCEMESHLDLGSPASETAKSSDNVLMDNKVASGPHLVEEKAKKSDYWSTTVEILEISPMCRRMADMISGVMRKHKYATVALKSLYKTLRTLQSTWRKIAIYYHEQHGIEPRPDRQESIQELQRCLVAIKRVMDTLNAEFTPFLNFTPFLDDTVGFTRLSRLVWKIRGYQDRIQAYTIVTFVLSQAISWYVLSHFPVCSVFGNRRRLSYNVSPNSVMTPLAFLSLLFQVLASCADSRQPTNKRRRPPQGSRNSITITSLN